MGKVNLNVELLSFTPNPQEVIALAAKLCYSGADINKLKEGIQHNEQGQFVSKLISLGHLSPIEHASFTFGVEGVSRSLLAQITRHRIASFSVKSQRYVSEKSKNSDGFNYIIPESISNLGNVYIEKYVEQMATMQKWYDDWTNVLGEGKESTKEDARFVLPNACETKFIVTMNARELMHFFALRCCNRAQWEIRELAKNMLRKVLEVAPQIFEKSGPACLSGHCPENNFTCGKMKEVQKEYKKILDDIRQIEKRDVN